MKGLILSLGILFVGGFTIIFSTSYHTESYRHNSIIMTMTESGRIASVNSVDKSSRIQDGQVEITEASFKKKFKEKFEQNSNVKLQGIKYNFSFLKTSEGGIKAARVKITDDRNNVYPVTFVSNIVKEEKK
ncbi:MULTISPECIES: hypothetical protein [Bacillus]|uniref:hypothetical protein n=1 Tax=Bacillus TaxID=1386 RepID=UPI0011AACE78|nr:MULTISPECIES: hypothetical protein [Bacillus]WOI43352.1 hypothetical protein RZ534_19850 [Bacillus altitudinis]